MAYILCHDLFGKKSWICEYTYKNIEELEKRYQQLNTLSPCIRTYLHTQDHQLGNYNSNDMDKLRAELKSVVMVEKPKKLL